MAAWFIYYFHKKGAICVFKYILRRLIAIIPKFFVITLILFVMLELSPGDPLTRMVDPTTYSEMTDHMKEQYRERLGLNKPPIQRYFEWVGGIFVGDFGYSTSQNRPIVDILAERMPYSMELQFGSMFFSTIIAIVLGYLCAVHQRTILDYFASGIATIGASLPDYFFALAFMIIFAQILGWFPTGGRMPTDVKDPTIIDRLPYLVLPIASMTFSQICGWVRFIKVTMVDVMNKDYIKTARAKGISETKVNIKHCLRNALPPVVTSLVMRIPAIIGGSVVIEQIFNYPGMGSVSLNASQNLDLPLGLFNIALSATLTLLASTMVDIALAAVDPRIRFE